MVGRGRCALCRSDESVLTFTDALGSATCEACASLASQAWRRLSGEVSPGTPEEPVGQVSEVSVLVARRRHLSRLSDVGEPSPAPREMPDAYEFLLVADGSDSLVPPHHTLLPGEDVGAGAEAALASVGLRSWPALFEVLHVGYTRRGKLRVVVLARGYACADVAAGGPLPGVFRPGALQVHAGPAGGFWRFMTGLWPLRIYKHSVPGGRPEELCVFMREAARRYVDVSLASPGLVGGQGPYAAVDASMATVYRASMTPDELATADLVRASAESERTRKQLPAIPGPGDEEAGSRGGEQCEVVESPGSGGGVSGKGGGEGEEYGDDEDEGGGLGHPAPEPGFAR